MHDFDPSNLKVCGYLRKSSETDDRQVQSISTQAREVEVLSERMKFSIPEESWYRETKSAFTPGRDVFASMVSAIESGAHNAIAVIHTSRIARNPIDAGIIIHLMDRGKLQAVISPSQVYRCTSTWDKWMLAFELINSKKDSDEKSTWVKTGLKTKALKGLPSGVAHLGFLNDFTNEKGNRKWKVDEERFPLVSLVFKRFLEGNISAGRLYLWARNELKLTTPKHKRIGGALVVRSRIYEMLVDPVYAGFFIQGGVRYELDPSLPRIITEDEYRRVLQLLGAKHSPKTKNHVFAFTGFMCGENGEFIGQDPKLQVICDCGRKFAYTHRDECPVCGIKIEKMKHPKYLAFNYYYNVQRKKAGHHTKHVNEKDVVKYVSGYAAKNLTLSPEFADWSRKNLRELADRDIEQRATIVESQEKTRREVDTKKARYREMLADALITPEEYRKDMERLDSIAATPEALVEAQTWLAKADEIVDLTTEFRNIIENGTVEAKRRVLSRLGSNLIWDEKELRISNRKSVQALVNGLNRVRAENPWFEPEKTLADKDESGAFAALRPALLRE